MGRNRSLSDYAGAAGRVEIRELVNLGPRWVLQPKIDGCYARLSLDSRGRVSSVLSRTGLPLAGSGSLLGAFVGWPDSELVGELVAGHVHLFDCLRSGGRYVGREPYRVRRDLLWQMQSEVVNLGPEAPWLRDDTGRAHDPVTGRFVTAADHDWRLTPIVPQVAAARATQAWDEWVAPGGEGLVAVSLDAPVGRGKRKCKPTFSVEGAVLAVDRRAILVSVGGRPVAVSRTDRDVLAVGEVVELVHEGTYSSGELRFARLLRRRPDLVA